MNHYIAFQKVVETGSFTKAAAELGYTQSSISQMIAALEVKLGIRLLIRSHHGIHLTAEGRKIYPVIVKSIHQFQRVEAKANEIKGLNKDVIRIGTISSITCHWLPLLIKAFKQKYPDVEFVMYQGDYNSIAEWIKNGTIDIGFTTPAMTAGLDVIPIKEGEMQAILPVDHPLAAKPGQPLPIECLADEPIILLEEGTYSEPLNAFTAAGIRPRIEYRIHDDYAIMTMVEAGLGISILANLVLLRMPFKFVRRPLAPRITREIGVAFLNRQELSLACQYFVDEIQAMKDRLP
ncbi:LysR family transcriptional regulator [Limosilactobacillus sp.]|uniref:LysR family transcriptional regulator n=1 Tax=Limosilactobacillus sp. TaxID=2773925 RepID=UPI003F11AA64